DSLSFEGRIVLSVFLLRIRFLFHWTENYKNFLSGISGPSHSVLVPEFCTKATAFRHQCQRTNLPCLSTSFAPAAAPLL
ncbi:MAG: hypothetical protein ACI81P_002033, partial [Neolewinella sp.]